LTWHPVLGAKKYLVTAVTHTGEIVFEKETQKCSFVLEKRLVRGAEYSCLVTAISPESGPITVVARNGPLSGRFIVLMPRLDAEFKATMSRIGWNDSFRKGMIEAQFGLLDLASNDLKHAIASSKDLNEKASAIRILSQAIRRAKK